MHFLLIAPVFILLLFVLMIIFLEIGRRIGKNLERKPEQKPTGVAATEGAVFALLGLMIAFTFSSAASRFDVRRQLIIDESNNIGTAYLRIDLLPAQDQPGMRNLFRQYVDSRLEIYKKLPDLDAAKAELARSTVMQNQIWSAAMAGCNSEKISPCTTLLLPAINSMIDITTTRTWVAQFHPPEIIFIMLGILSLIAALFTGYGMAEGKRSWIHIIGFAAVISLTVYLILEIEYPRRGLIRLTATDQILIDVRNQMK